MFVIGLDLGQAADFTALAVLERLEGERWDNYSLHVRHLQRFPLRTPYPKIAADVAAMMKRAPLAGACNLVVDATGVGRPVVDLLEQAGTCPRSVTITSGDVETEDEQGGYRVPKRDLVSGVAVLLQSGRLKSAKLPEWPVLESELLNFQVKITTNATDTYGAWREGQHDDLVLAVALACWWADRDVPLVGYFAE